MMSALRPLAVAVAVAWISGAGVAEAQTVIVRHAKAGTPVELVVNTTPSGSVTADATGTATLTTDIQTALGKSETDAYLYADICSDIVRVHLVERGVQPPPPVGECTQRQGGGVFWLRRISSIVIDVGAPSLGMRLKQGSVPEAWLTDVVDAVRRQAPTGLVFFGGAGLSTFSNVTGQACGDVSSCESSDTGIALSGGAAYWITPFLGVEASYLRPASATASGGESFTFDSELDAHLLNVGANVGPAIGPVRVYGKIAATYHRASFTTTQTSQAQTVTIDGQEQTIEGGTQNYEFRTGGWGWTFGGGLEGWASNKVAIYVEAGRTVVTGDLLDPGEGDIDDRLTYILAGIRFRLGG
jgi:hypothetical protein